MSTTRGDRPKSGAIASARKVSVLAPGPWRGSDANSSNIGFPVTVIPSTSVTIGQAGAPARFHLEAVWNWAHYINTDF